MELELSATDRAMLAGELGEATSLAMRIIVSYAEITDATKLIDITGAHIDACLYHGLAGVEFAEKLRDAGGEVRVRSTLNVSSMDLLHPELFMGDRQHREGAIRLMKAYVDMGCEPTWTCAPYHLPSPPALGEHVAWAESNAIVYANSVLGARTGRYGDFLDIAAALTGRVPHEGLHMDENRRAETVVNVTQIPRTVFAIDVTFQALGHLIGELVQGIPVIVGLPSDTSDNALRALGAAGASSGDLAMFHAVGLTPEAQTLEKALGGQDPVQEIFVTVSMLQQAIDSLSTSSGDELAGVAMGTPHFSLTELRNLAALMAGRRVASDIAFFVSTSRHVYGQAEEEGTIDALEGAGIQPVVDTCTYLTPAIGNVSGVMMTNSAKWAYYAPGNLGVQVVLGSLRDCVESAVAGRIVRDMSVWSDA